MNVTFKHICDKDCEAKKIFEDAVKYRDFVSSTLAICATCIHCKRTDKFVPRESIEDTTTWQKIKECITTYCLRY